MSRATAKTCYINEGKNALPVLRLRSARTLLSVKCCVCNFHPFSVYLQRSCKKVKQYKNRDETMERERQNFRISTSWAIF